MFNILSLIWYDTDQALCFVPWEWSFSIKLTVCISAIITEEDQFSKKHAFCLSPRLLTMNKVSFNPKCFQIHSIPLRNCFNMLERFLRIMYESFFVAAFFCPNRCIIIFQCKEEGKNIEDLRKIVRAYKKWAQTFNFTHACIYIVHTHVYR